jgi:hypothetical protein
VVFYDFLGWRNKILSAGNDPKLLGRLRRKLLGRARMAGKGGTERTSTFSDNVVKSVSVDEHIWTSLLKVCWTQVASAYDGFWLRGGIAIGDIVHDAEVVFGPALNEAHRLESKVARFPRVVVDPQVVVMLKEFDSVPGMLVEEQGIHFLDPFTEWFIDMILGFEEEMIKSMSADFVERVHDDVRKRGISFAREEVSKNTSRGWLEIILMQLEAQMAEPLDDASREKLVWLYKRISPRIGGP